MGIKGGLGSSGIGDPGIQGGKHECAFSNSERTLIDVAKVGSEFSPNAGCFGVGEFLSIVSVFPDPFSTEDVESVFRRGRVGGIDDGAVDTHSGLGGPSSDSNVLELALLVSCNLGTGALEVSVLLA